MTLVYLLAFAFLTSPLPPSLRRPRTPTPIELHELRATLASAYRDETGYEAPRSVLRAVTAIVRWENGNGSKVYQHNLGNLGAARGEPRYLDAGGWYAVFPTAGDGARALWRHLRAHCKGALAVARWGDGHDVAHALRVCSYYQAPEDMYARGLAAVMREEP